MLPFQNGRMRDSKERLNQSRTKHSREHAKLCSSLSGILEFMMGPTRLQRAWVAPPLFPFTVAPCSTHSISLFGWLHFMPLFSLGEHPGPGISSISGSPLQFRLRLHPQWPLRAPLQGFQPCLTLPGPSISLELKEPWCPPLNLASFMSLK